MSHTFGNNHKAKDTGPHICTGNCHQWESTLWTQKIQLKPDKKTDTFVSLLCFLVKEKRAICIATQNIEQDTKGIEAAVEDMAVFVCCISKIPI